MVIKRGKKKMTEISREAGELEVTLTFTNAEGCTAEGFKAAIESGLAEVGSSLSGTIVLLPDHNSTGVIIGSG